MCQAESGQTICKAPNCDRPIYVESNGIRHPFCGRTCANKYGGYVYNFSTPAGKFCKRVGCNKLTFVEPNGRVHPYCGRSCAYNDITLSQNGLINLGTTTEQLNSIPTRLSPTSTASSNSTISSDSCEEFVVVGD